MSSGEFLGLLFTVSLLGVLVGAAFTWIVAIRRHRPAEPDVRRREVYARWLAARISLTRASASFVAAFRALATERTDAEYFALRREEAQRTRNAWWEAMRELDGAEAMLLVWSDDPTTRERLAHFDRVEPEALRKAIDGSQGEVDALLRRLREADSRAADLVCVAAGHRNARRSKVGSLAASTVDYLASIVEHWSRR